MSSKKIEQRFEAIRMLAAVLIAVVLCFAIILMISEEPMKALKFLVAGPFTTISRAGQIVEKMQPLLMTGCALNLMILAGNFSVIAEGCFLLAPCLTVGAVIVNEWFAPLNNMGELGRIIWVICSMLFGALIGGLVGCLPSVIKRIWGCDEVITSIMLNAIIVQFDDWMVKRVLYDESAGVSASKPYPEFSKLTKLIYATRVTTAIFIGLVFCILTYYIVNHTKLGFEARLVGLNPSFAKYSGINVQRTGFIIALMAGAFAGIGGVIHTLSFNERFNWVAEQGYGNNGIFVGILAKNNPLMLPFTAFFLGYLLVGAETMGNNTDVPLELINVMTSLIIMMLAAESLLAGAKHRAIVRNAQKLEAAKKEA
jgi:simple sugar transport system permease protein